ncbi:hypothetical protein GQ43DRAFT_439216 [Delitschia confertaspora ATCC 74209]|uniref:FAD-binding FR-type domain-containing protein n=1 Tax=Delitschia confertaspora ATCC 74209 TaxID=1513339 RepID=A0A9P4MTY1_9PLEO|nr:hypothetical protein GQ43DRAFT_439216 [Delitschia confertaspora ATCC 74209]
MSWIPSILLRPHSGALVVLGGSALGGAAYRYTTGSPASEDSLNPHSFTPYTLLHKQPVSSNSAIFILRNRNGGGEEGSEEVVEEAWRSGVWSVQVKQPQLQIARAYTPLPSLSAEGLDSKNGEEGESPQDLRFLIRKEHGGEVSNYLHNLPAQSTIELRGPNHECEIPDDIKEVVFLAGGTGIAPAMQVASLLGQRKGSRMHILWANRRREECLGGVSDEEPRTQGGVLPGRLSGWRSLFGSEEPIVMGQRDESNTVSSSAVKGVIVRELEALKRKSKTHAGSLNVDYFVDEEKSFIRPADVVKQLQLSPQHDKHQKEKGSKLILISGPDGFIEYWAGKKLWVDGRETQGQLGGVLGGIDLRGWRVYKL